MQERAEELVNAFFKDHPGIVRKIEQTPNGRLSKETDFKQTLLAPGRFNHIMKQTDAWRIKQGKLRQPRFQTFTNPEFEVEIAHAIIERVLFKRLGFSPQQQEAFRNLHPHAGDPITMENHFKFLQKMGAEGARNLLEIVDHHLSRIDSAYFNYIRKQEAAFGPLGRDNKRIYVSHMLINATGEMKLQHATIHAITSSPDRLWQFAYPLANLGEYDKMMEWVRRIHGEETAKKTAETLQAHRLRLKKRLSNP